MIALPLILFSLMTVQPAATPTTAPSGPAAGSPTVSPAFPPAIASAQPSGAAPSAAPSVAPSSGATPAPGSPPSASAGATPGAPAGSTPPNSQPSPGVGETPSPYKYRFVPHRPASIQPGQPVIEAIYLNSRQLRSEGPILIKVQTNDAVVKVISRSNGHEGAIPGLGGGNFEAASKVPKLPVIAHGMTVDLEFVATSADGRKTSVRVPIKLE